MLKNFIFYIPNVMAEETEENPETAPNCKNPQSSDVQLNCLFQNQQELIGAPGQGKNEGTTLAEGRLDTDFIPFFVNLGVSIAGTLIFIAFLYAGYLLVFVNDKEEEIEKGKKILTYAVVGAIMIAISYAVIYGIANLDLD